MFDYDFGGRADEVRRLIADVERAHAVCERLADEDDEREKQNAVAAAEERRASDALLGFLRSQSEDHQDYTPGIISGDRVYFGLLFCEHQQLASVRTVWDTSFGPPTEEPTRAELGTLLGEWERRRDVWLAHTDLDEQQAPCDSMLDVEAAIINRLVELGSKDLSGADSEHYRHSAVRIGDRLFCHTNGTLVELEKVIDVA